MLRGIAGQAARLGLGVLKAMSFITPMYALHLKPITHTGSPVGPGLTECMMVL